MATIQDFEERIEKQKAELAKLEAKKKELEKKIRERNRKWRSLVTHSAGESVLSAVGCAWQELDLDALDRFLASHADEVSDMLTAHASTPEDATAPFSKTPTGNRKGSRVTEITGSLFSCPHSEIKATGRKDFRYCNTAHRRTGRESGRTISKRVSNCERSMKSDWKSPQNRTDIVKHNHRLQAERSTMDFSSYYYYIPLNFYETPEMTLIDHEPNGDSATVLVLALAKIHTRTVTKNDDGTFTIVTDDGTFTDTEVMEMLSSFGYRANHAKYTHALAVVARFPPFDHLAYSEGERDKKTPEVYR